jgi:hypothetical protein
MPALDAKLIFAVLGPVFLLMGLTSLLRAGGLQPQSQTWLLVGTIFSLVAAWLWWGVR